MTLRVTIRGVPASYSTTGGWRCSDALVHESLLAACEPDTDTPTEFSALAKAVRHFSADAVLVVEGPTRGDWDNSIERDLLAADQSWREARHRRIVAFLARRSADRSLALPDRPSLAHDPP